MIDSPSVSQTPGQRRTRRRLFSLRGRAAPRLYAAGWLLTLGGFLALWVALWVVLGSEAVHGLAALAIVEAALASLTAGLASAALAQGQQRRADGVEGYDGPSPLLVYAAVMTGLYFLGFASVAVLTWLDVGGSASFGTLLELLMNLAVYVAFVGLLVVRPGSLRWSEMARPRRLEADRGDSGAHPDSSGTDGPPVLVHGSVRPGWELGRPRPDLMGDVIFGLALVIPAAVASGWAATIAAQILRVDMSSIPSTVPVATSPIDRLLILLAAAVIAPIGEEIFFRGFATTAWAKSMAIRRAIVQSAIFFAAVHIVTILDAGSDVLVRVAVIAVIARIPVALALSWVFLRRRSIYASLVLHGGYNALLTVLSWQIVQTIR